MPTDPIDETAIQFIVAQIKTISTPTYHTNVVAGNVIRNFKNPLDVLKTTGATGFPLVQVVGPYNTSYETGTESQRGGDWNRLSDIQVNTFLQIYMAVLGLDSYTQLPKLRDDVNRILSNDFTLGGNTKNWKPVSWVTGYAWEKQSGYMGTGIWTIQLIWTYRKATP
jgi:hypothetical protein|tara:strand:- start:1697 stop:2197 length:501 start_codon:yes stop_codon:yes gene_type:complete